MSPRVAFRERWTRVQPTAANQASPTVVAATAAAVVMPPEVACALQPLKTPDTHS
jgi:hypothetical protein